MTDGVSVLARRRLYWLIAPVRTLPSLLTWSIVLILPGWGLQAVWSTPNPTALAWGATLGRMTIVGAAGLAEEASFRWLPRNILGYRGLWLGSAVWVTLHQFSWASPTAGIQRLPGDVLAALFFVKLWRGKWWWLAFAIHAGWNALVVLAADQLG